MITIDSKPPVRLTAAELANLWTQYMNDSMAYHFLSHAIKNCQDQDIKNVLEKAVSMSEKHLKKLKGFFNAEKYPVPHGFTKADVNLNAPPLFSDSSMLIYMQTMTLHGLTGYALSVGTSVREDIRNFYIEVNQGTMDLYSMTIDIMLKKGVYVRPPSLNPPEEVDFVKKQSFLNGWFGDKRPINAIELSGIFYNMQKNHVKILLEIGFSQVATSAELRDYFLRGMKVCEKQNEVLGSILASEHLPEPGSLASEVTNSTTPPFSDKLMLFHVVSLISVALGYYGAAVSVCQRRDLSAHFLRLMAEIGQYAEDGANLLIKNGWLEQPPTVTDRESLATRK
ncbi:DUF3231 family protein [Cytobacillus luteolus]|nr:DUF3231 family protein [Cytobacillus luteolus]MBP1941040.1 hypothetical protein [Cytobacillus luteolus]